MALAPPAAARRVSTVGGQAEPPVAIVTALIRVSCDVCVSCTATTVKPLTDARWSDQCRSYCSLSIAYFQDIETSARSRILTDAKEANKLGQDHTPWPSLEYA